LFLEYCFILKYFLIAFLIGLILFFISTILVFQQPNAEKLSSYECGFNPYGDARNKFEVKFCLIGILFIIFDLEIIFLFPWILILDYLTLNGFISMLIFLIILTYAFFVEWLSGALDWN